MSWVIGTTVRRSGSSTGCTRKLQKALGVSSRQMTSVWDTGFGRRSVMSGSAVRRMRVPVKPVACVRTGYRVPGGIVSWVLVVVEGEFVIADQCDGARVPDGVHP